MKNEHLKTNTLPILNPSHKDRIDAALKNKNSHTEFYFTFGKHTEIEGQNAQIDFYIHYREQHEYKPLNLRLNITIQKSEYQGIPPTRRGSSDTPLLELRSNFKATPVFSDAHRVTDLYAYLKCKQPNSLNVNPYARPNNIGIDECVDVLSEIENMLCNADALEDNVERNAQINDAMKLLHIYAYLLPNIYSNFFRRETVRQHLPNLMRHHVFQGGAASCLRHRDCWEAVIQNLPSERLYIDVNLLWVIEAGGAETSGSRSCSTSLSSTKHRGVNFDSIYATETLELLKVIATQNLYAFILHMFNWHMLSEIDDTEKQETKRIVRLLIRRLLKNNDFNHIIRFLEKNKKNTFADILLGAFKGDGLQATTTEEFDRLREASLPPARKLLFKEHTIGHDAFRKLCQQSLVLDSELDDTYKMTKNLLTELQFNMTSVHAERMKKALLDMLNYCRTHQPAFSAEHDEHRKLWHFQSLLFVLSEIIPADNYRKIAHHLLTDLHHARKYMRGPKKTSFCKQHSNYVISATEFFNHLHLPLETLSGAATEITSENNHFRTTTNPHLNRYYHFLKAVVLPSMESDGFINHSQPLLVKRVKALFSTALLFFQAYEKARLKDKNFKGGAFEHIYDAMKTYHAERNTVSPEDFSNLFSRTHLHPVENKLRSIFAHITSSQVKSPYDPFQAHGKIPDFLEHDRDNAIIADNLITLFRTYINEDTERPVFIPPFDSPASPPGSSFDMTQ